MRPSKCIGVTVHFKRTPFPGAPCSNLGEGMNGHLASMSSSGYACTQMQSVHSDRGGNRNPREQKLISVVLPAKNEAADLAQHLPCLRAAFRQAQFIVVDDGFSTRCRRTRLVQQGQGRLRRGKYVLHLGGEPRVYFGTDYGAHLNRSEGRVSLSTVGVTLGVTRTSGQDSASALWRGLRLRRKRPGRL